MPQIPIVSQVVNLKDQKVRQAAYVVNTPGAWLPDPEIIGQRPKSRSKKRSTRAKSHVADQMAIVRRIPVSSQSYIIVALKF